MCKDGSYRNNVILIRPDGASVTDGKFELDNFENYMNDIEVLWLNMSNRTWKEADELLSMVPDYDYDYDYDQ